MDSSSSVYVILTVCAVYGVIVQVRTKSFPTKCSFLSLIALTLLVLFRQELSTRLRMRSKIFYQTISDHKSSEQYF